MPAANATRVGRGASGARPSCGDPTDTDARDVIALNEGLEEIVHRVLGLVLGVQELERVIAKEWQKPDDPA